MAQQLEQEKKDDPLDKLFVDRDAAVDSEELVSLLIPYIQLTQKGEIFLLKDFHNLKNREKLLVLLLGKKVLSLKGFGEDGLTPVAIREISGLGVGTVGPTLTDLVKNGLVKKSDSGYTVPNGFVSKILELFNRGQ